MRKLLRVGVIGVGAMGRNHARVYSELSDAKLIGIADIDEKLAAPVAQSYECKAYANYEDLLNEKLDAVSIAMPTLLHKRAALAAIEKGINILVEKPIADTIENATKIIEAAKRNGVKLMVGHIERFNPIVAAIKESIADLQVVSIDITRVGPLPPRIKDVGVIVDLAIHDIDLTRYLANSEFKRVYGLTSKSIFEHEDTAILSFEMENGILAHITVNWLTPFKVREINVATTENFIKGWFMEQKVYEYSKYQEDSSYVVKELNVPRAEPLKLELKKFIECIEKDEEPPITGQDGLRALEIAMLCLEKGG